MASKEAAPVSTHTKVLWSPRQFDGKYFVNNQFRDSASKHFLSVYDPSDGSLITDKHVSCTSEEVDSVVATARAAFKGPWSKFTGFQRAQVLLKFADLMEKHAEELAYYETLASGRVLSRIGGEVSRLAQIIRYYAGWADKLNGESITDDDGYYKIITHEPLGVVAGISPYNGAVFVMTLKAGPALATGNTFILKPPEKAPLSSLFLASLLAQSGLPDGVFNVVTGDGSVGAMLSSHMDVDKISFTGSVPVGRKIAAAANASNMKRVSLELGGKSPAIVFEDADVSNAIKWLSLGVTMNAGQVCVAPSRIYVHETIADEFIAGVKNFFEDSAKQMGRSTQDKTVTFGPVIDQAHVDRVHKYIENGKTEAVLVTGGYRYEGKGTFVPPTIFKDPEPEATILKEEIFGPVLCISSFKSEEEAIAKANDTRFGLAGYVFSENITRILRVTKQIEAGIIGVNSINNLPYQAPFGGYKQSGVGKELGKDALRSYMNTKTIYINTNRNT